MDLEAWLVSSHIDWEVWISLHVVIGIYDGKYTAWDRHSGEEIYHGANYDNDLLPAALQTIAAWGSGGGRLTLGEVFSAGW